MPQSIFNRGQGLADPSFVHDSAIIERDIEIHAHEDAVVVQRQIANGEF
jgi:hypothetical protein